MAPAAEVIATTSSSKRRSGSCTASAAMPCTADRVGMRATRMPSARACSAAAAAVCRSSASLGSRTTSRAWARRTACSSSPLAGGSPGRASTVVAPASAYSPARPSPGTTATTARWTRSAGGRSPRAVCTSSAPKWVIRIRYQQAGLDARLDGGTGVVHVHVDVPQPVAADHHEGVPERVQPLPQPRHGGVVGLQQIDHLEGGAAVLGDRRPFRAGLPVVPRGVLHSRVPPGGRGRRCARCLPRAGLHQCPEHRHEPAPPGVDHSGALQHGELPGGGGEGGTRPVVGGPRHGTAAVRARPRHPHRFRGVRGGRGNGEHCPLHRVGDGLAGGVGGAAQGEPQPGAVGVRGGVVGGEHLGHATQQLGEDGPGVAARPDQRPVRHRAHGLRERRPLRPARCGLTRPRSGLTRCARSGLVAREHRLHGGGGRLDGQIQVRAGVAVRHRVHVDRVDLLARPPEGREREPAPGAHRESIEECLRHLRHLRLLELLDWSQRRPRARWRPGRGPGRAPDQPW
ncbi:hypothetical protein SGLAM104S_09403 [Streptomyces glaucescens]